MVDRFHAENTYIICLSGRQSGRDAGVARQAAVFARPKTSEPGFVSAAGRSLCEIRLLSVDKKFRTGQVFQGLMALVWQFFVDNNYDLGVISGTTRQLKLYHHLGLIPFGPLVGAEGAHVPADVSEHRILRSGRAGFFDRAFSQEFSAADGEFPAGPGDGQPACAPGVRADSGIAPLDEFRGGFPGDETDPCAS